MWRCSVILFVPLFAFSAPSDTSYTVTTVAGSDPANDFGVALNAVLDDTHGIALDSQGNIFVADTSRNRVFRVSGNGALTLVAGNGRAGYSGDGGPADQAALNQPYGLALDTGGSLYIADLSNGRVRRVSPDGRMQTIAGGGSLPVTSANLQATDAMLRAPRNVAVDQAGNLYVSDFLDHRILKITTAGRMSVVAGTGGQGPADDSISVTGARFSYPAGLLVEPDGTLLVADSGNHAIRIIAGGTVNTVKFPLLSSYINLPTAVCLDRQGNLVVASSGFDQLVRITPAGSIAIVAREARDVVADSGGYLYIASGSQVRRLSPSGDLTVMAGVMGQFRGEGTPAIQALLYAPMDVQVESNGSLLIADTWNHRVRRVREGIIQTIAGDGNPGTTGDGSAATRANLAGPHGVASDGKGVIYIADTDNHRIRRVGLEGTASTVAGTGVAGFNGEVRELAAAQLNGPSSVAVNPAGQLVISDSGNHRVRVVISGYLVTIAGNGQKGYGGDGGGALGAQLDTPRGIAFDSKGNLYIADTGNRRVRKVAVSGAISTIIGPEIGLIAPAGVTVDAAGVVYVSDSGSARIVRLNVDGTAETIGGTGVAGFSGDAAAGSSAQFSEPSGISVDSQGNLFIADRLNNRIRKLTVAASHVAPVIVVEPAPTLRALHGATLEATSIAPGMLVSIEGNAIGPAAPVSGKLGSNGMVETAVAGIQVRFDGKAAPVLYAQANLINVQAPYRLAGASQTLVEVVRDGVVKAAATFFVVAAAPGVFTSGNGSGPATALNEDLSTNASTNTAARGSLLTFFATGEGVTDPAGQDGKIADSPYPVPVGSVRVSIGEQAAEIVNMGCNVSSPAVMQLTVRVPLTVAAGSLPLSFSVGGEHGNQAVTVFVK